jgi:hypothetical protein
VADWEIIMEIMIYEVIQHIYTLIHLVPSSSFLQQEWFGEYICRHFTSWKI